MFRKHEYAVARMECACIPLGADKIKEASVFGLLVWEVLCIHYTNPGSTSGFRQGATVTQDSRAFRIDLE